MPEEVKQVEPVSPEIQEVMRNLVSAFRAVKLYPPNNPIYSQSVHKAFESLDGFLQHAPHFTVGVQKTYFLFEESPVSKDTQINKTIAQDIFAKGIREIVFLEGVTEDELTELCKALALLPEEMAMQSGIVSILWEKSATHVRVTEAALEEVITTHSGERIVQQLDEPPVALTSTVAGKELHFKGRTLLIGDLIEKPGEFGNAMLTIAQSTLEEGQTVEDRLHELYREAGRQISQEDAQDQDALFRGLAKSVLEIDAQHRDKFISSKLYAHLDAEGVRAQEGDEGKQVPEELHEIVTGRFSKEWSVQQIASLLKKSSQQPQERTPLPLLPSELETIPLSDDIADIAREVNEYTADEMEILRAMSEVGNEADIMEASVRTLIFLLSLAKADPRVRPLEETVALFAGIVEQLETALTYLVKNKEFDLATIIVRAFHIPVEAEFKPRLDEAIRKASGREIINGIVTEMRQAQKTSPEYLAAYSYLTALDEQATSVLLETLAAEKDRSIRRYLLDILKDLGRNQIAKIGQRVSDGRWFVVRNVVHILGESRSEEALVYLERVTGHKQAQIRHEVIKSLIGIGGGKAAAMVARFLQDKDIDIRLQAIRGLGAIGGASASEARLLENYLRKLHLNKVDHDLSIEGIRSLARIGDLESKEFLKHYLKRRWWRSRRLQGELRIAAVEAMETLGRRAG